MREREIVIDRTSALNGCEYEWGVHVAIFAGHAGLSDEEVRATVRRYPSFLRSPHHDVPTLVRQEVQHLNRLVEDLIEISRFDAGTAQLVTDETDIANAVGQCLRARGWSNVCADVSAGVTARLDRRRFDVVLANLVGNALRHGGPPVSVKAGIQQDGQGGEQLAMEVRDQGHGLPAAAIPYVFDRFYKADTARARSEGSGLGLAIAWENARLHGGHIHAGNHPDGGAVFTVSLPVNASGSP